MIRLTLPGPVSVFNSRAFRFTLVAPKPTPTAASATVVLMEIFVAPAMVTRWRRGNDRRDEDWKGEDDPRNDERRRDPKNLRRMTITTTVHRGMKRIAQRASVLHRPIQPLTFLLNGVEEVREINKPRHASDFLCADVNRPINSSHSCSTTYIRSFTC
jgi:hypothetical protein